MRVLEMKILEIYARGWLDKRKVTNQESQLVLEFAREVEKLMGITEEEKNEKN